MFTGDQSLVSWSDKQLCEVCDEKIDAVKRCIECEQNFCKPCSKVSIFMHESRGGQGIRPRHPP